MPLNIRALVAVLNGNNKHRMSDYHLRFPIGEFEIPSVITSKQIEDWINDIAVFPQHLSESVKDLSNDQLDTAYRPNGWTIRQVVHHCADSHMNSLIRFKLALTENNPTIKPYDEAQWAELSDSKTSPIQPSLQIINGLHERWVILLKSLTEGDLTKVFTHPEHRKTFSIAETIGLYAWHGRHHLAHITTLKQRKNW